MKKIKLTENDLTSIVAKVISEQDLSKIDWNGKHRYWFQYHNTFSGCRVGFTKLLKELIKYFGEDVTKEVNQLILSFKRAMIKDRNANPSKSRTNGDKNAMIKYLKPEFERIGIVWTDEDEEELKSNPTKKLEKKKDLVENALWGMIMEKNNFISYGTSLYKTCRNDYERARDEFRNRDNRDYKKDFEQSQLDYTKISGDNKELQGKLKAANVEIKKLRLALKNAGRNDTRNQRKN